jgi:hypothetical protein
VRWILIVLSLVAPAATGALTIAPGDLVDVTQSPYSPIEPRIAPPIYLLNSGGALKGLAPRFWPFFAFGSNNHLFAMDWFNGPEIKEYDNSFNLVRIIRAPPTNPMGLLVAPNGDFGYLDTEFAVHILGAAGQLKATYPLPNAGGPFPFTLFAPSFDLAPDGCTLLYTDAAHIGRRFNLCMGTALANLPTGPTDVVRALADGGYVAVHGHFDYQLPSPTLDFYDTNDQLVRSFEVPNKGFAFGEASQILDLRFDSDPQFLWITAGDLRKVRISDGTVMPGSAPAWKFAVNGETRPTIAGIATSPVPATSSLTLAALACAIIVVALRRLS